MDTLKTERCGGNWNLNGVNIKKAAALQNQQFFKPQNTALYDWAVPRLHTCPKWVSESYAYGHINVCTNIQQDGSHQVEDRNILNANQRVSELNWCTHAYVYIWYYCGYYSAVRFWEMLLGTQGLTLTHHPKPQLSWLHLHEASMPGKFTELGNGLVVA